MISINNKGMTTIEASVIIPISLAIIMLLVWLGFFFFNKNALSTSAARAVMYGSEHSEYSNEEIKNIVEEKLNECLENNTVLIKDLESEIVVDFTSITILVKGKLEVPSYILFGNIYDSKMWEIELVKRAPRLKSSSFVRAMDFIKKGEDKMKSDK